MSVSVKNRKRPSASRTSVEEARALYRKAESWALLVVSSAGEGTSSAVQAQRLLARAGKIVVTAQVQQANGHGGILPRESAGLFHATLTRLADLSVRVERAAA